MKRKLCFVLLFMLSICLVGCGKASDSGVSNDFKNPEISFTIETSQKIYYTVNISLKTDDVNETVNSLFSKVDELNGYMANSSITNDGCSSVVFRVPTKDLFTFLNYIESDGNEIVNKTINTNDITSNYNRVEARLEVLKASKSSYLNMLEKANNVNEIISIQNKIEDLETEILELEMKKASYDNLLDYSTITINLNYEDSSYFKDYLSYLIGLCEALFTIFIYTLPFGLIALVVIIIIKVIKKKNNKGKINNENEN